MLVTRNKHDGLLNLDASTLRFREFVGGFGWPETSEKGEDFHKIWFAAIGVLESGDYLIVAETGGRLDRVIPEVIQFKDDLLIRRIFHDGSDLEMVNGIRRHFDGLFGYEWNGHDTFGRRQYVHPETTWPSFRDRTTVAGPVPVPEYWKGNIGAAVTVLSTLWNTDRLQRTQGCHMTQTALRLDAKQRNLHPLVKAVAWPVYILESFKPRPVESGGWTNPYPNL